MSIRGNQIDGYTTDPYPPPWTAPPTDDARPPFSYSRVLLSSRIAIQAHAAKPFWITEIGWSTDAGNRIDPS